MPAMKKLLLLLLLLLLLIPCVAHAQFPMVGAWNVAAAAGASDTAITNIDSLKGYYVSKDLADSLGKASGDTTYILPNRAKWIKPYAMGDLFQLTSAAKPVYRADSSTLVFDGVDDAMQTVIGKYAQPSTITIVFRANKPYEATAVFYDGAESAGRNILYCSQPLGVGRWYGWASNDGPFHNSVPTADSVFISHVVYNGASSYTRLQGVDYAPANPGPSGLTGLTLGDSYTGALPNMAMSVRTIIVCHRVLTTGELDNIDAYLSTQYSITLP
jgi:hypothetical protein